MTERVLLAFRVLRRRGIYQGRETRGREAAGCEEGTCNLLVVFSSVKYFKLIVYQSLAFPVDIVSIFDDPT